MRYSFSKLFLALLTTTLLIVSNLASAKCGVYRWSIKTGSDQDVSKIDFAHTQIAGIENLTALIAPINLPQSNRISPTETEVFQIQATLLEINQTDDSDYHLLIADSTGHKMIAEIPDPQCVSNNSPIKAQIQTARAYIDQKIQVTHQVQKVNIPVTVAGIGFFDMPHAQGAAANGIELHPVLNINFLNSSLELDFSNQEFSVGTQNTIPNFLQVTNDIFRGGRPNNGDLAALKSEKNIKAVINLENKQSVVQQEQQTARNLGLKYISSPMNASVRPTDQQVNQILAALQDSNNDPIFIHCHHGQDRSGLIIGLYRVEVQGWAPAKAYQEMIDNGFHTSLTALDTYFRDRTGFSEK